jgi:hypothetical protein
VSLESVRLSQPFLPQVRDDAPFDAYPAQRGRPGLTCRSIRAADELCQLGAGGDAEFGEGVADVGFHCVG